MSDDNNLLPCNTGVSLKPKHYQTILETLPNVGWFEIHPENYMGKGGPPHKYLTEIRNHYPLSMHGVGISLGSAEGIDDTHLKALADLVNRYQPEQVSEHLSWSHIGGTFLNDLLPLPYNQESLQILSANIDKVQTTLGMTILVENPSTYINFNNSSWSEPEFLNELAKASGCGLLLDVNNIYVSACNQGFDPIDYIADIPKSAVGEIHLAGHSIQDIEGFEIRIDDHGSPVKDAVWKLHRAVLALLGKPHPVLIEWDTDVPEFSVLLGEANKAEVQFKKIFSGKDSQVAA
ncbi:MAG: hypothetical protein ACI9XC_000627 [Gammaproteobacteria bacterium]|jgi:uncharacterized protein (UPF0276 family)